MSLSTSWNRSAADLEPDCHVGLPKNRLDCGFPTIPSDDCHRRKCCWDDSIPDVPWCFFGREFSAIVDIYCDVGPPSKRVDCGYPGIVPKECGTRKCCWNATVLDVPWCFFGINVYSAEASTTTVTPPPTARCDVLEKSRKRCGRRGITRKKCVGRGCCWKLSKVREIPSCYHGKSGQGQAGCNPHDPDRILCGYVGAKKKMCLESHCCWDDTVPHQPKCYRPNTGQQQLCLYHYLQWRRFVIK